MSPLKIINKVHKEGVQISFSEGKIVFWPTSKVDQVTVDLLHQRKAEIIRYLQGYSQIRVGDPVVCIYGLATVWEVYPESGRVAISLSDGTKCFLPEREIGCIRRYRFLSSRMAFIEKYVYSHPKNMWSHAFQPFQFEWSDIFKRLNSEQFLIESFCGPIRSLKKESEVKGEVLSM